MVSCGVCREWPAYQRAPAARKGGDVGKETVTGYLILENGGEEWHIPLYGEWPKYVKEWLGSEDESFCPNPFEIWEN